MDMKKLAGDKAATYVKDGMVVGLGTGSTAYHMVNAVGEMVKNGLKIQAIPTSKATEAQARRGGSGLQTGQGQRAGHPAAHHRRARPC